MDSPGSRDDLPHYAWPGGVWRSLMFIVCMIRQTLQYLRLKILFQLSASAQKKTKMEADTGMDVSSMTLDNWTFENLGMRSVFTGARSVHLDWYKVTRQGAPPPDIQLYQLELQGEDLTSTSCRLLDYCNAGRPLVLNFGSWTWPPYKAQFATYMAMARKFSKWADFLAVYIEEAHAEDGFRFKNNVVIHSHQSGVCMNDFILLMMER